MFRTEKKLSIEIGFFNVVHVGNGNAGTMNTGATFCIGDGGLHLDLGSGKSLLGYSVIATVRDY